MCSASIPILCFVSINESNRFASSNVFLDCEELRSSLSTEYAIPPIFWTPLCRKSNGFFGSESFYDADGHIKAHSTLKLSQKRYIYADLPRYLVSVHRQEGRSCPIVLFLVWDELLFGMDYKMHHKSLLWRTKGISNTNTPSISCKSQPIRNQRYLCQSCDTPRWDPGNVWWICLGASRWGATNRAGIEIYSLDLIILVQLLTFYRVEAKQLHARPIIRSSTTLQGTLYTQLRLLELPWTQPTGLLSSRRLSRRT